MQGFEGMVNILKVRYHLGYYVWWAFITTKLDRLVWQHLTDCGSDDPWVATLVRGVESAAKKQNFSVRYHTIFKQGRRSAFADALHTKIAFQAGGHERKELIRRLCLNTVAQWVGLTKTPSDNWRSKGSVIHAVIQTGELGVFLLKPIQQACEDLTYVFGKGKKAEHDFHILQGWLMDALESTDVQRAECRQLTKVLLEQAPDLSCFQNFALRLRRELPTSDLEPTATVDGQPVAISQLYQSELHMPRVGDVCLRFVRDIKRIATASSADIADPSLVEKFVLGGKDQYCPFRETSPSRNIFVKISKALNLDFRRKQAFYNLLTFRSITFSSKLLLEPKDAEGIALSEVPARFVYFPSVESFEDLKAEQGKGQMLEPMAYGQSISQRHMAYDHPELLWRAAQRWEEAYEQLPEDTVMSFTDAVELFGKEDMHNNMPSFGKLIGTLLLGDLVYAGVVEEPTPEQFIRHFLVINLGANMALHSMKYVLRLSTVQPQMLASEDRVQAVLLLYHYIRDKLKDSGEEDLMPDVIHFEHLLCKVQRLESRGPAGYKIRQF